MRSKGKGGDGISFIGYNAIRQLSLLLDPHDAFGNDWRMLADILGFSFQEIRKLERENEPTKALLSIYSGRCGQPGRQFVDNLYQGAMSMGRTDAANVLQDILDKYDNHKAPVPQSINTQPVTDTEKTAPSDEIQKDPVGWTPSCHKEGDLEPEIGSTQDKDVKLLNIKNANEHNIPNNCPTSPEDNSLANEFCQPVPNDCDNGDDTCVLELEPGFGEEPLPPSVPELCSLLRAECRACLVRYLQSHLPSKTKNVAKVLREKKYREKIETLKENSIITEEEFALLYPAQGVQCDVTELDLPLLVVLIRNITRGVKIKWDKTPQEFEISKSDDVLRIRAFYPLIKQESAKTMDLEEYDELFVGVSEPLRRMGANVDNLVNYRRDRVTLTDPEIVENLEEQNQGIKRLTEIVHKYGKLGLVLGVAVLLVIMAVIVYVVSAPKTEFPTIETPCRKNIELIKNHTYIQLMPRAGWKARYPSGERDKLVLPAHRVIIAHTGGLYCGPTETQKCCEYVKSMQDDHMDGRKWYDIGYNFLVAEDGVIYEGRGWDYIGAHSYRWNNDSYGIAFIGDFRFQAPKERALTALKEFLKYSVYKQKLSPDYVLYGQCQVRPFESPGEELYKILMTWDHWQPRIGTNEELKLGPHNRTSYCVDDRL
ncbi:uncharacterized protein LOC106168506 [Lingula anatina]|uniref:Uncharacterized protein LOC106168506 n=1 Tax=Lingula anatina TaxID=7574 RepID=A0A1S3IYI1_LINAN|nr:uncharacterized protein LOC106168506 [Lingula anatina]|eukprot:XP_013403046.1 uncharacterized protein LOC106168506 [Lingula anatina]